MEFKGFNYLVLRLYACHGFKLESRFHHAWQINSCPLAL